MRFAMAFFVVFALTPSASQAQTIGPQRTLGAGGKITCDAVNIALSLGQSDAASALIVNSAVSWMMGYLTATHDANMEAVELDGDLLRDVTEDDLISWFRMDCDRRPDQTIQQAARRFVVRIHVTRSRNK